MIGGNWKWPEASTSDRAKIWQEHKDCTLELIWFLQTDSAVPEKVRTNVAAYGFAKDEFNSSSHWPPMLYIREARRMLGEYFITQADILTKIEKEDCIGIGSFPIDSHDCQRVATEDGGWVNEGTIYPVWMKGTYYGQPHQLPYRSLLPKKKECENLLVPVCLSSSHVALSSIRVEPTWMVLGHSAGVAAAIAAKRRVSVHDVASLNYSKNFARRDRFLIYSRNI